MPGWRSVARLALRDLRNAPLRAAGLFALFLLAVVTVTGVSLAARAAAAALRGESRAWLGGDLALSTGEPLEPAQLARLAALPRWTLVLQALSAAASANAADPVPTVVQAVDPAVYPLYGQVRLDPPVALDAFSVAVSEELLQQLGLRPGEALELGGVPFRAAAVIRAQADRLSGATALPHRVLLSHQAYERSRLAARGVQTRYRYLVRLAADADAAAVRALLESLAPEGSVIDHRAASRAAAAVTILAAAYFQTAALLALVLAAAGAGLGLRRQMELRQDTIAILRVVGAARIQIAGVFAGQAALLLAAALAAGVPLSLALGRGLLAAVEWQLALPGGALGAVALDRRALGEAWLAAALAFLPGAIFVWRATAIRPAQLWRRGAGEEAPGVRQSWSAALLAPLGAGALSGSWAAAIFALLLLAGAAVMFGLATAVLALLRPWREAPLAVRQGLTNLRRPAHRARLLISALGCGVALVLTAGISAEAVARQLARKVPAGRADLAVFNFAAAQRDAVRSAIEALADVVRPVEMVTQARLRLAAVNGAPPRRRDDAAAEGWYVAGCREGLGARAALGDRVAAALALHIGDRLEFAARDRTLAVTVGEIAPLAPVESFWYSLAVDCAALAPESLFHQALVRVRPGAAERVRAALQRRFPALAVVGEQEIATAITALSRQALTLARAVAALTTGLGAALLIAFVFSSQAHRAREAALLAALGARPAQVRAMYAAELAALGFLAGLLGVLGAAAFSSAIVFWLLGEPGFVLGWRMALLAPPLTALLTAAAGWAPVQRVLRARPLAALRGE